MSALGTHHIIFTINLFWKWQLFVVKIGNIFFGNRFD